MKRFLRTALVGTLALGLAAPAFAKDHEISGFFRVRGIMADLSLNKEAKPDKLMDQRFRAQWRMALNEYVAVVYFGEVDFQWGDASYSGNPGRNDGGAIGGDTVNLETKQLYADIKIPETPVAARLGLQGFADNWDWTLFLADMAGAKVTAANLGGMADVTLGWFKLLEGETNNNGAGGSTLEDDVDLYALQVALKPMDALRTGVDFYWINNNGVPANAAGVSFSSDNEDLYYVGLNASYKLAPVTLSGWFFYNFGTMNGAAPDGGDMDISAWATSVKADFSIAGAQAGIRGLYFSGDDDLTDSDMNNIRQPFQGVAAEALPFGRDGLMILTADLMQMTYPGPRRQLAGFAMADGAWSEAGLWGFIANASYTPPALKNMYVKGAAGWFRVVEDEITRFNDEGEVETLKKEGKNIGTELAARVGYKIANGAVDLSLNGAYAWLGDFYDNTATNVKTDKTRVDPDNPYLVYAMLNIPF